MDGNELRTETRVSAAFFPAAGRAVRKEMRKCKLLKIRFEFDTGEQKAPCALGLKNKCNLRLSNRCMTELLKRV